MGVELRSVGIALADGICDLGGSHFVRRPPWLGKADRAPYELYSGICLRAEEKNENLSQRSE
jgi:hypothetical protein